MKQFERQLTELIPIAKNIGNKLRNLMIANFVAVAVIVGYLITQQHWSLLAALLTAFVLFLPSLVLFLFYSSVRDIQDLPQTIGDVSQEVKQNIAKTEVSKKGILSGLWQIRSLLGSGLEEYASFTLFLNPLLWILGLASVLVIIVLALIVLVATPFFLF